MTETALAELLPEQPSTSGMEWHAVGWMTANMDKALPSVRKALAKLLPFQFADDDAREAFLAVREAASFDAPKIGDVVTALLCVGFARGDYERIRDRLFEAAADSTTADRRAFDRALLYLRDADRQRQFIAWQQRNVARELSGDAMRRAVAELRDIFEDELEEPDAPATDALSVADRWAKDAEERLIRTGFPPLDKRFGGGLPTGITAITAKPGVGKSVLAGQIMLGALLKNPELTAVWFRFEMTESLLWSKFLATWSSLRGGDVPRIGRKQAARRDRHAKEVSADLAATVGERLHIVGLPSTTEQIRQSVDRIAPGLIVIDYLQQCRADGFQDRRGEIDHVLSVVGEVTTQRDIATIVVSSMAGSSTKNTPPIGAMTKETNKLDYDAHNYVTLWCAEEDKEKDPRPTRMDIIKGRTGGEGAVDLLFTGSGQFFSPQADERFEHDVEPDPAFAAFAPEPFA